MRRTLLWMAITVLLLGGLVGAARIARAGEGPPPPRPVPPIPPLVILEPAQGQVFDFLTPRYIQVGWTRTSNDAIFYRVQVFLPAGSTPEYIEHRWVVPEISRDWRRRNPFILVDKGLLVPGADHTIVITAYGPGPALIAEFGDRNPLTRVRPRYPTDRSLDYYVQIGDPSPPVTIHLNAP